MLSSLRRTVGQSVGRTLLDPLPRPGLIAAGLTGRTHSIAGKRILVTGASSGIGRSAVEALTAEGATVVAVARRVDELEELGRRTGALPFPCDLTDGEAIDALVEGVLDRLGGIDVLLNNAGHSIRRSAADTVERPYDHDRLMRLNYHAPVRLTLDLLCALRESRGQVINSSTWGVPGGLMPNFTAYHASKAALSAFSTSLQAEERANGVAITQLHFPLMRTPMIAPTTAYAARPALEPDAAVGWVMTAIRHRPAEMAPAYVTLLRAVARVSPRLPEAIVGSAGI